MSNLAEEAGRPFTLADRVQGVVIAFVFAGLGVWMWLKPALVVVGDETASGRGGRKVMGLLRLVDLVWSRPLGVILLVLGALVLFGAVTKNRAPKGAGVAAAGS